MTLRTTPRWWTAAACANTPTRVFFSARKADQEKARTLCASCPVIAECREEARGEEAGFWAGVWRG